MNLLTNLFGTRLAYFSIPELPNLPIPWYGRPPLDTWRPLKQWVYSRDGGRCHYCGGSFRYEDTHCHHLLELSEGGTNHPTNLKTVCVPCHKARHPFMQSIMDKERRYEATAN